MKAKAYIKHIKTSPKKLRLIAKDIKKISVQKALETLLHSRKRASKILYKSIQSAVENLLLTSKGDKNMIQFQLLTIEEGSRLKRFRSGGRGTAKPYRRKMAHIKIILTNDTKN